MRIKKMLLVVGAAVATTVVAAPALADEPIDDHQEYQCSPGLLGTGLLCNSAPAPGPAPEDDLFQGGPLGADSELANVLRGLFGG
jgi:hypothetical protein